MGPAPKPISSELPLTGSFDHTARPGMTRGPVGSHFGLSCLAEAPVRERCASPSITFAPAVRAVIESRPRMKLTIAVLVLKMPSLRCFHVLVSSARARRGRSSNVWRGRPEQIGAHYPINARRYLG